MVGPAAVQSTWSYTPLKERQPAPKMVPSRRSETPVEGTSSDMATRQKRKPSKRGAPPARARRSLLASRRRLGSLVLAPHHVDIVALAVIAFGVFLAGVAYFHWAGG